jgi:hypothetical protein
VRAATFSRVFSEVSEKLFPSDYPGKLPSTFPSSRFELTLRPEGLTVDGRGYGHAVGMTQYGAKALADRGTDARQILARYYGGLQPTVTSREAPLRVGIAEAERALTVTVEGSAQLSDALGHTLVDQVSGSMVVQRRSDGALSIVAPSGMPRRAWVSGLDISATQSQSDSLPLVSVVVSEKRRVALSVRARGAKPAASPSSAPAPSTEVPVEGPAVEGPTVEGGPGRITLPLPPLSPGDWAIGVDGAPDAGELILRVRPSTPPLAVGSGHRGVRSGGVYLVLVALVIAVLVLGLAYALWRK